MILRTLDTPMLCHVCHVEQLVGAQMAVYRLGSHEHLRCASCEREIYGREQLFNRQREANNNLKNAAGNAEFLSFGSDGVGRHFTPVSKIKPLSELPQAVQAAQQRAVGER